MPQMLNPGQAQYVAVPNQAKPTAAPQPQQQPQQSAPARNPFVPAARPIPLIILPHEADEKQGPSQQSRHGQPVRMSFADASAIYRNISTNNNHTDRSLLEIFADAMDDSGFHKTADVFRRTARDHRIKRHAGFTMTDSSPYVPASRHAGFEWSSDDRIKGTIGPVPVTLTGGTVRNGAERAWELGIWPHLDVSPNPDQVPEIIRVSLPHKDALDVMREITPTDGWQSESTIKHHLGKDTLNMSARSRLKSAVRLNRGPK